MKEQVKNAERMTDHQGESFVWRVPISPRNYNAGGVVRVGRGISFLGDNGRNGTKTFSCVSIRVGKENRRVGMQRRGTFPISHKNSWVFHFY